jgi:hypothetical protein
VRLGTQQNPIHRLRLGRIGQRPKANLNRALRSFDDQPLDRAPDAGDDIVPIESSQQSGDDSADAAKADDGNARSFWTLSVIA